jgi:hypothetical protein
LAISWDVAGRKAPLPAGSMSTQLTQVSGVGLVGFVDAKGPCQSGWAVNPCALTTRITGLSSMASSGNSAMPRALPFDPACHATLNACRLIWLL